MGDLEGPAALAGRSPVLEKTCVPPRRTAALAALEPPARPMRPAGRGSVPWRFRRFERRSDISHRDHLSDGVYLPFDPAVSFLQPLSKRLRWRPHQSFAH